MKILSISNMPIWLWGKGKGIPSIFFPQREFAKRGHEVHFLCPVKGEESRCSLDEGIHIHRFDFPFNFRQKVYFQTDTVFNRLRLFVWSNLNWFFFQCCGFLWGLKIGRRIKPDIVYAHSMTSVFPAYLVSRILKTRLIVRAYGTRQLYWRWQNLWLRLKECRDYLTFKVPADYFIITNDGSLGNLLAKKLGVKDEKILCWRNGIDDDCYDYNPSAKEEICRHLNINPSRKIIASTCRLIPDYGVGRLLNALVDLFQKNSDAVCVVAGSGPERKKLEEFVKESGISDRVFFLGIVDRDMIKKILNAADIFVFLPKDYNCTNTIWETMACGRCIVTVENDPIREVLTSGRDAVLVPQKNMGKLGIILGTLLEDDKLREEMGRNARARAREVLESWDKRLDKEIKLLEELIES